MLGGGLANITSQIHSFLAVVLTSIALHPHVVSTADALHECHQAVTMEMPRGAEMSKTICIACSSEDGVIRVATAIIVRRSVKNVDFDASTGWPLSKKVFRFDRLCSQEVQNIMDIVQDIRGLIAVGGDELGRQRKELKLHKVKGYYSTYRAGRETKYKYFGTRDPEEAHKGYREWRKLRFGEHVNPGARLTNIGRMRHAAWRNLAFFIMDVPAEYAGGERKIDGKSWKLLKEVVRLMKAYNQAREDVETAKRRRKREPG